MQSPGESELERTEFDRRMWTCVESESTVCFRLQWDAGKWVVSESVCRLFCAHTCLFENETSATDSAKENTM